MQNRDLPKTKGRTETPSTRHSAVPDGKIQYPGWDDGSAVSSQRSLALLPEHSTLLALGPLLHPSVCRARELGGMVCTCHSSMWEAEQENPDNFDLKASPNYKQDPVSQQTNRRAGGLKNRKPSTSSSSLGTSSWSCSAPRRDTQREARKTGGNSCARQKTDPNQGPINRLPGSKHWAASNFLQEAAKHSQSMWDPEYHSSRTTIPDPNLGSHRTDGSPRL